MRRRILGKPDPAPPVDTGTGPDGKQTEPQRATGDTVRRPDQTAPDSRRGNDDNPNSIEQEKEPVMANTKAPQPIGPVYTAARQVHAVAVEHTVKGTMELRTEAYEFPWTIAELAAAVRARADHCTKEAVDPAYAQALVQIATTVDAAAQAAARLGPAFDALHQTEVNRILKPRPNESKWDTVNNRP